MFAMAERNVVSGGIDVLVSCALPLGLPLAREAERVEYTSIVVESFVMVHGRGGRSEQSASRYVSSVAEHDILLCLAHNRDYAGDE